MTTTNPVTTTNPAPSPEASDLFGCVQCGHGNCESYAGGACLTDGCSCASPKSLGQRLQDSPTQAADPDEDLGPIHNATDAEPGPRPESDPDPVEARGMDADADELEVAREKNLQDGHECGFCAAVLKDSAPLVLSVSYGSFGVSMHVSGVKTLQHHAR